MALNYTTNQREKYTQLSATEREDIMTGLAAGKSLRQTASAINRSASSISREIMRNSDRRSGEYRASLAHSKYQKRTSAASSRERIADEGDRQYIEEKMIEGWSPEQIAGRRNLETGEQVFSHETVYQYIYRNRRDLAKYLVRAKKKRKKRGSAPQKHAPRIKNKTSIQERPESVNSRAEHGHWEADTMVSRRSKASLCVLSERKYKLTLMRKIDSKTTQNMKDRVVILLKPFPEDLRKTITFDNGTENALHEQINKELGTQSYFCNPYHSWEKGSVENAIGLIRQYLPKITDLNQIDEEEILEIEYALNNIPRKCLKYLTPIEAYMAGVALDG